MKNGSSRADRETMDIPEFAVRFGCSKPVAYELARLDQLPVPTIRIGRRVVVSRRAVEDLLNKSKDQGGHDEAA
jgi:predicted DNA-binding transcriptional regulator AlpA